MMGCTINSQYIEVVMKATICVARDCILDDASNELTLKMVLA